MKQTLLLAVVMAAGSMPVYAGSVDTDAVIGGAIGGATGAAIGSAVGGRNGAIVGAGVGGATGAAVMTSGKTSAPQKEVVYVHDDDHHHYKKGPNGKAYGYYGEAPGQSKKKHKHDD